MGGSSGDRKTTRAGSLLDHPCTLVPGGGSEVLVLVMEVLRLG